jgi:hypothetical protein
MAKPGKKKACSQHTHTEGYDTLQEDMPSHTPTWAYARQGILERNVVISVCPYRYAKLCQGQANAV